jgi:hypothetical protein
VAVGDCNKKCTEVMSAEIDGGGQWQIISSLMITMCVGKNMHSESSGLTAQLWPC